jgi:hypothetical protein
MVFVVGVALAGCATRPASSRWKEPGPAQSLRDRAFLQGKATCAEQRDRNVLCENKETARSLRRLLEVETGEPERQRMFEDAICLEKHWWDPYALETCARDKAHADAAKKRAEDTRAETERRREKERAERESQEQERQRQADERQRQAEARVASDAAVAPEATMTAASLLSSDLPPWLQARELALCLPFNRGGALRGPFIGMLSQLVVEEGPDPRSGTPVHAAVWRPAEVMTTTRDARGDLRADWDTCSAVVLKPGGRAIELGRQCASRSRGQFYFDCTGDDCRLLSFGTTVAPIRHRRQVIDGWQAALPAVRLACPVEVLVREVDLSGQAVVVLGGSKVIRFLPVEIVEHLMVRAAVSAGGAPHAQAWQLTGEPVSPIPSLLWRMTPAMAEAVLAAQGTFEVVGSTGKGRQLSITAVNRPGTAIARLRLDFDAKGLSAFTITLTPAEGSESLAEDVLVVARAHVEATYGSPTPCGRSAGCFRWKSKVTTAQLEERREGDRILEVRLVYSRR